MSQSSPDFTTVYYAVLLFILFILFYFLPFCLAVKRRLEFRTMLFLVNLFLGWTVAGWFVCLLWAALGTPAQKTI